MPNSFINIKINIIKPPHEHYKLKSGERVGMWVELMDLQKIYNLNSDMEPAARSAYNSLMQDLKLMPLSSFKSNRFSKYNLFPHAQSLPPFFDNNLQSEGRVVKFLKGPEGPLRAFYYQLFKLGFEIESTVEYATTIKNIIFSPSLASESSSPTSGKQYNIGQYKRIVGEFIGLLEGQVIPNAELTYSQYPIIDEAMLAILELIVAQLGEGTTKDGEEFYRYGYGCGRMENLQLMLTGLCRLFGISLQIYDNCFSFVESDVFLYVQSLESSYLAFLSEMAEVESYQKTSESPSGMEGSKQQISSNSYIQPKPQQPPDIYKNIRLSAGNKDKRNKAINISNNLNKSVPLNNSSQYGSHSFGTSRKPDTLQAEEGSGDFQKQEKLQKNVFASDIADQKDEPWLDKPLNIDEHFQQLQKNVDSHEIQSKQVIQPSENGDIVEPRPQENPKPPSISKPEASPVEGVPEIGNGAKSLYEVQTFKSITQNNSLIDTKAERCDIAELGVISEYQLKRKESFEGQANKQLLYNSPKNGAAEVPPTIKITETVRRKSCVKLNDKIYQYQFKSFKYRNINFLSSNKEQNTEIKNQKQKTHVQISKQKQSEHVKNETKKPQLKSQDKHNGIPERRNVEHAFTEIEVSSFVKNGKGAGVMEFFVPASINGHMPPPKSTEMEGKKKQASSFCKMGRDETMGTFYREFSDTRVMDAMIEPFRTKVKLTRQKFKGIRSRNFLGFF